MFNICLVALPDAEHYLAEDMALAEALMRLGGICEWVGPGDGDLEPGCINCAIEAVKFADARDAVVRDDFDAMSLPGFGLDSIWICEPAAVTECVDAALELFAARKPQQGIDSIWSKPFSRAGDISVMNIDGGVGSQAAH